MAAATEMTIAVTVAVAVTIAVMWWPVVMSRVRSVMVAVLMNNWPSVAERKIRISRADDVGTDDVGPAAMMNRVGYRRRGK